jgi:hypothetical protein
MRLYMEDPDNPERLLKIPPHVFQAIHDDGYEEGHADGHDMGYEAAQSEEFNEGYYAGLDDAEVIVMETIAQPHPALTGIRALRRHADEKNQQTSCADNC